MECKQDAYPIAGIFEGNVMIIAVRFPIDLYHQFIEGNSFWH